MGKAGIVGSEWAGVRKHVHGAATVLLHTQLFCRALGEVADGLQQRGQAGDGAAKAAGAGDLLLGRWLGLQLQAGNAVQLAHGALQHHAKVAAYPGHGGAAQVQGGDDVMLRQPLGNLAAHAPNVAHGGQAQQVFQALRAELC